jgi:hypothetical protein
MQINNPPSGYFHTLCEIGIKAPLLKTKLTCLIILMNYGVAIIECSKYGLCLAIISSSDYSAIYRAETANYILRQFGQTGYLRK